MKRRARLLWPVLVATTAALLLTSLPNTVDGRRYPHGTRTPQPQPTPTLTATLAPTPTPTVPPTTAPTVSPTLVPTATPTLVPTPPATPIVTLAPPSQPIFIFADEFNGTSLGSVWGTSAHWTGLSEATTSRSHSTVANGYLTITATRIAPNVWVSDTVDTFSRFSQTYSYFEARIRYNSGRGLWPAWWLAHDWIGDKSELDVNEALANPFTGTCGDNSSAYYVTLHDAGGASPSGSHRYCAGTDLAGAWHTYGMDWRSDHTSFYIDDQLWYTYSGSVTSSSLVLIFNLAVGGWAGSSDSTTPSPSTLDVDWVHVSP